MSGCLSIIQRGGVAVGVPRITFNPCRPSLSIAFTSQPKCSSPGFGSSLDQANSPMRT
jgi:hypothetical protein